ncbi:MAG: glycosyltransferase [Veillonellaceae bacterium]|nr:glycosyltransferase [Veillonellaceae bacterium]
MLPLVSILIPAYNAERWLRSAIVSALNQTWPRREVIVVDDGSTDNTVAVAQAYESSGVKVVSQRHSGASAARNRALALSQGDYVQWLDADDVLAPDKIERQLTCPEIREDPWTLGSSAWGFFYRDPSQTILNPTELWSSLAPGEWLYRKCDRNVWMAVETWLVSKQLCDAAGIWNEELLRDNDGEYFCRILRKAKKVHFVPESLVCVRRGVATSISNSSTLSRRKLESIMKSLHCHIDCLLALENSERTKAAGVKMLQRHLIYFYPEHPDLVDEAKRAAASLGGRLIDPELGSYYRVVKKLAGFKVAKRIMFRRRRSYKILGLLKELIAARGERKEMLTV